MNTLNKILKLFDKKEKKEFFILLFIILLMAFIDMLGIASIIPFLALLTNPQILETNFFLSYLYERSYIFGVKETNEFLFLLGVLAFILLIFSLLMRALTTYAQVYFSSKREYSIGKRLIECYLHQPYQWFLKKNSIDITKNILSEVNQVIAGTIVPLLSLIAQGSVALIIIIFIFLIDVYLAINIGLVLIISYISIFFLIKKLILRIGAERFKANQDRFKLVADIFSAFKEIKISSQEDEFISRFSKTARIYANNQSLVTAISQLPRYFFEAIAFGGLIILVIVLMKNGNNNFSAILPLISLYALAGYRLIPSLQQVYYSCVQINFSSSAIDNIYKDLINLQIPKKEGIVKKDFFLLKKFIKLDGVCFNYADSKKKILKDINITIKSQSKIAIIGPTGSGKTTLANIILGLLEINKGNLIVDEIFIDKGNIRSWQKKIGYVPQQIYLSDASIVENIAFGIDPKQIDLKIIEHVARVANLHDFIVNELPQGYNTVIGERGAKLSGGQRQRIGIARALYHKPQIIILDEATNALDNITEYKIINSLIKIKKKITLIYITHRLNNLKYFDMIYLLKEGEIKKSGNYKQLNENTYFKKLLKINNK
jgi:ABC-type bacteriocin/lantibiotic exporter with double-glycine peptidase domain